jgi:putative FmdB family regulatory protein
MPRYEYACRDCGEHLEVVQSFKDDALTECPSCKGRLRKVFTPVGITFKGSGFYKTDSRTSGKTGKSAASSESSTSSEKSESKSAASSDTKSTSDSKTSTDTKSKPSTSEAKSA